MSTTTRAFIELNSKMHTMKNEKILQEFSYQHKIRQILKGSSISDERCPKTCA